MLPLDDKVLAEGGAYHRSCFKCTHCNGQLSLITMAAYKGKLFCKRKFSLYMKIERNSRAYHNLEFSPESIGA